MLEIQSHQQVFENPIMQDIVITVYQPYQQSQEFKNRILRLGSSMGATILTEGEIIPYFTTHILTNLVTEGLKSEIDKIFGTSKNSIFF